MLTALSIVLTIAVLALALGAMASVALTRAIEALHPPRGRFISADSVRLHVVDLPARDPAAGRPNVLLLHGANLCLADMQMALGERLSRRLRVIIPDRPGQGFSEAGPGPVGSAIYQVGLLRAAMRQLETGPLIVVGHSFGGLLALRYALDDPSAVAGLVLINPTTHPRPQGLPLFQRAAELLIGPVLTRTWLLPLSLAMLAQIVGRLFRPEPAPADYATASALDLGLTPRRFSASLREYADLRAQLVEHVPRYGELTLPVVIVAGEADPVVPPKVHAEALLAALPQAKLVRLAGAGHMAHHAHAEAIAIEIEALADRMAETSEAVSRAG